MKARRIRHPSDFSAASRPAFARAVAIAKAERAELVFLGSVAERVVGTAPCPVLTVRGQ